ncbi:hypothetical protein DL1_03405 [Thioclava dalianensis]|uniref:Uncharacterized protein n=1 Tax=Thioclava dalianensis TaxID=1185766 RepID=A0A074TKK9_9RHOB|nr:hypothetical protein [Thioclava dalianensis]KEP69538.1 hypothetical protein DL1_03405 [Thioclava dalianensis]SFN69505.1 hypothetical protein SAMN05216224_10997 [Thioclava dalianensis]
MRSENTRKEWLKKAEKIHRSVKNLNGLEQAEAIRQKLDAIVDESERSGVEMLVWYWLGHGKEPVRSGEWLNTNRILAATFAAVFLIGWFELGISFIWSGTAALVTTVFVRIVFRMLDRGFMFRRLFTACISSGLILIVPAQFAFAFETPFGPISWGGAPSGALVLIWVMCTLLTFCGAVWEHYVSDRT